MDERRRSRGYPGADLEEAIQIAKTIQSSLGVGSHSREDMSKALGSKGVTGGTARKIAATSSFGLLRKTENGYAVSPLAKKLFRPLPGEEEALLQECFFSVPLYRELVEKYEPEGQIPNALPTLLERNFGIMSPNGTYAAKVFRDSAAYAGVLDPNGYFNRKGEDAQELGQDSSSDSPDEEQVVRTLSGPATQSAREAPKAISFETINIVLPSPGVTVIAPKTMTAKQKERTIAWLDQVVKSWLQFIVEEDQEEGETNYA